MRRGPRVHFCFQSPYSWLALQRLGARARELEFVPFWSPDPETDKALTARGATFHYAQMSKAKHLYLLYDTKREAAKLGVSMRWPVDVEPWWELPHLAFLRARELGAAQEFYAEVCAARWGRGEDICTQDVIAGVARRCGLPVDPVVQAAADPEIRAAGVECLYRAYEDDIFGIPYFRMGRHRFWGLDRVDGFLAEMDAREPAAPVEPPVLAGSPYDTDTSGGCG
ncbi:2-hydroxychromene-2-carboxylate isomerase [Nonomuraea purpurea]|uniref:2-hydroxychromene-2-carboxylate isomerase n=1 Tax=Nonomuraea purpurea TaxID=1849276 RepID=A0ABV8GMS1_9ACTN